jgi:hypothetical protein
VLVICVQVCVCVCVVLYIVFSYTLCSYLHITTFQFLPVNQQMYLCDTFRLIAVCQNYCVLCLEESVPSVPKFFKKKCG